MSAVVYRWSDDARVLASTLVYVVPGDPVVKIEVALPDRVVLLVHPSGAVSSPFFSRERLSRACLDLRQRRRLIGFLLDLGASTRPIRGVPGMVVTDEGRALVDYPSWVPDEEWATRYRFDRGGLDESRRWAGQLVGPIEDFSIELEYVSSASVCLYVGRWGATGHRKKTGYNKTAEAVVDEVLKQEIVLPESYRELWEPSNVERGTWVRPTPDEVELYGCLGDPLPFFWGGRRFLEWLAGEGEEPFVDTLAPQAAGSGQLVAGSSS